MILKSQSMRFVIMCKPEPVCEWRGLEYIKLKQKA